MTSRDAQQRLHAYMHLSVEQWPGGNLQDMASRPQPYNVELERLVALEAASSTLLWMRALDDCFRGNGEEYQGWSEYVDARKTGVMPAGAYFKWSPSIAGLISAGRFAANKAIHVAAPVIPDKEVPRDTLEGWVWAKTEIYPIRPKSSDDRDGSTAYRKTFEGRRVERPLRQLLHWFNWWNRWLDE